MSDASSRSFQARFQVPKDIQKARREADAFTSSQFFVSPKIEDQPHYLPSSQVPKVSQGQSLSVQQQHFHVTFARRMGLNHSNLFSLSQFSRSSDEDECTAPLCCRVALAIANRYLKQCQVQSHQYCRLRQHYSVDRVPSSAEALSPTHIGLHDQDVASYCDSEAQAAALGCPTEDF